MEMADDVYGSIQALCEAGNACADAGDPSRALGLFRQALALIPQPRTAWEATTWVQASIGDMLFVLGAFDEAERALREAVHSPGGLGNPFIHLRLGESLFELENRAAAADELMRAFMGAGFGIFEGEDPKYLAHLRTVAILDDTGG